MNRIEPKKKEDGSLEKQSSGLPLFSYREDEEKRMTVGILLALIVTSLLLMAAVAAAVRLNEASLALSDVKKEIETLEKQQREYESELEKKNDMVAFEQYAVNELGMLKGKDAETDERQDTIE